MTIEKDRDLFGELSRRLQNGEITNAQIQAFMRRPDRYQEGFMDVTETLIGKTNHYNGDSPILFDGEEVAYISSSPSGCFVKWGGYASPKFPSMQDALVWADGVPMAIGVDAGDPADARRSIVRGDDVLIQTAKHHYIERSSLGYAQGRPYFVKVDPGTLCYGCWGDDDVAVFEGRPDQFEFSIVNGQSLYKQDETEGTKAVYGSLSSAVYPDVDRLSVHQGKMLLVAKSEDDREFVVYDGKEYRGTRRVLHEPMIWRNQLLALGSQMRHPQSEVDLLWGGESIAMFRHVQVTGLFLAEDEPLVTYTMQGKHYLWRNLRDLVRVRCAPDGPVQLIDDKAFYLAYSPHGEGKWVYAWGMQRTKSFDAVSDPIVRENDILFAGIRGRKIFRVSIPRENATT